MLPNRCMNHEGRELSPSLPMSNGMNWPTKLSICLPQLQFSIL